MGGAVTMTAGAVKCSINSEATDSAEERERRRERERERERERRRERERERGAIVYGCRTWLRNRSPKWHNPHIGRHTPEDEGPNVEETSSSRS